MRSGPDGKQQRDNELLVAAAFRLHYGPPDLEQIPFDGSYKVDDHEIFVIDKFALSDNLTSASKQPNQCDDIYLDKETVPSIKSILAAAYNRADNTETMYSVDLGGEVLVNGIPGIVGDTGRLQVGLDGAPIEGRIGGRDCREGEVTDPLHRWSLGEEGQCDGPMIPGRQDTGRPFWLMPSS
jgi:hypothetical protein